MGQSVCGSSALWHCLLACRMNWRFNKMHVRQDRKFQAQRDLHSAQQCLCKIVRGPSLKRWRFGPTRGNKGLTLPTISLTYEKQFWLGRTQQKRVKLDENEQGVFAYGCHGNGHCFSRNPPFNASIGCLNWSKVIKYSGETLDLAGLQRKSGNSLLEDQVF